jgi:hypothetical protein
MFFFFSSSSSVEVYYIYNICKQSRGSITDGLLRVILVAFALWVSFRSRLRRIVRLSFSLPNYGWARVPFLGAPCALAVEGAVHPLVYNLLVVLIAVGWVGVLVQLVEMLCLGTRVACVKFKPQVTTMQISVCCGPRRCLGNWRLMPTLSCLAWSRQCPRHG